MKPVDYFATHPVFRFDDFVAAHQTLEPRKSTASKAVLQHHLRAGHLLHVRRGLYAVVPRRTSPESLQIDPFLLARRGSTSSSRNAVTGSPSCSRSRRTSASSSSA